MTTFEYVLDDGVVSTQPISTRGGTQMANFVNEDSLYDVQVVIKVICH